MVYFAGKDEWAALQYTLAASQLTLVKPDDHFDFGTGEEPAVLTIVLLKQ